MKATVENPRGSVEKLSPMECHTMLRGSVRAPEGFSEGKPEAAKLRGRSPQGFAAEGLPKISRVNTITVTLLVVSTISGPEQQYPRCQQCPVHCTALAAVSDWQ